MIICPAGVEVVFADIRDRGSLTGAFGGARRVYHLAANPNLWVRDRGEFDAVNHRGTVNVLDAALEAGAGRVLHTSTESILTRPAESGPINENVEISLSDAVGPYCRSKLLAEKYALFARRIGPSGRGGEPHDAGRPGRLQSLSSDQTGAGLLSRSSSGNHDMHSEFD